MSTHNATLNKTAFILKRLAQVLEVKGDDELAKALGVARNTLSTWRNRDSTPYKACEDVSNRKGVFIDWLLTGEGPMYRQPKVEQLAQTAAPEKPLSPREKAVVGIVRMLPDDKQGELLDEFKKRAEGAKQLVEMMERMERLEQEKGKCA